MPTAPDPHADVAAFIATVPDQVRRADAERLVVLMREATGEAPQLWGSSIIGFGTTHYRYATGREGDTVAVGFAPRARASVLYLCGQLDQYAELLAHLGPHRRGKGCLSIPRVGAVDVEVLTQVVRLSYERATG
ncbi:MAG: DUF1801 domain-containing protein [Actinobacteria bacterium]|nr:DUF1801 domain-containing protein [Actinomycetota bacterium]MCG2803575.1 DUF1801 domain-containing protein [Cellulomonas sp.]